MLAVMLAYLREDSLFSFMLPLYWVAFSEAMIFSKVGTSFGVLFSCRVVSVGLAALE